MRAKQFKWLFLLPIFCFYLLLFCTQTAFTQTFEGTVLYEIPELLDEIGTSELKYMIKGEKVRLEYKVDDSQENAILFDTITKNMHIYLSMFAGYIEVPPEEFEEAHQEIAVDFEKTNEKRQIAGQECEIWVTNYEGSEYNYCIVENLGNFIIPSNSMTIDSIPVWASFSLPENSLPLFVSKQDGDGTSVTLMQAKQIEMKEFPAELFTF